jgi:AcrR family transcriptional regulator
MHSVERKHLREQILTQALPLFIQRGYLGLSMREIAQSVGVSKPALYYHFRDKESLFLAILVSNLEVVGSDILTIKEQEATSHERIRRLAGYFLSQPVEQRALIRLGSQELAHLEASARQAFERTYEDNFLAIIRGIIQDGIESGELKPVDPGVATWSLLGILLPLYSAARARPLPPEDETLEEILSIFLDGIAVRK